MGPQRTSRDTARQRRGEGRPRQREPQSSGGARALLGLFREGEWPGGAGGGPALLSLGSWFAGISCFRVRAWERALCSPSRPFPVGPLRGFRGRLRGHRCILADLRVLLLLVRVGGAQGVCLTAVVFPTDRSGMENSASVEQLQETLLRALRALVLKNRPSETSRFTKLLLKLPDLRTLNNMHSEKLLSFRVDAQ